VIRKVSRASSSLLRVNTNEYRARLWERERIEVHSKGQELFLAGLECRRTADVELCLEHSLLARSERDPVPVVLKESSGHPVCSGCWVEWWRGYRGRTA
jgi:hypothetical protein